MVGAKISTRIMILARKLVFIGNLAEGSALDARSEVLPYRSVQREHEVRKQRKVDTGIHTVNSSLGNVASVFR